MNLWYLYLAVAAYLVFGLYLTHGVLAGMHRPRRRLRDWVLGAISMPILFAVGLIFIGCEKLWAWLLPLLAFDKPEDLRAGPAEPGKDKPGDKK